MGCEHEWKLYLVSKVAEFTLFAAEPRDADHRKDTTDFSVCKRCHAVNFIPDGCDEPVLLEAKS